MYLLYQISDFDEPSIPPQTAPLRNPQRQARDGGRPLLSANAGQTREERVFDEAFAPGGLPRLPARDGRQVDDEDESKSPAMEDARQPENISRKGTFQTESRSELNPTEMALLRDLPFTLQGLSSTHLSFSSSRILKLPHTLPPPIISILHTLAEPSLLYKGLAEFVQSSEGGLLGQSLRAAIEGELRSYLGLVATLEAQIRRALSSIGKDQSTGAISKTGVTLRRCIVWTREATMGLRLLSLIAEESKG